jgi:hypothetical protein
VQETQLINNLFAQSVNQHRRENGVDPLPSEQVLSESSSEPVEPSAATQPAQPVVAEPPGPVTLAAQPHEIVARSTDYTTLTEPHPSVFTQPESNHSESMSQILAQALSRLSDPAAMSRKIHADASAVIPEFSQAPSCATCKASTLDSSLNQLTCQSYGVLVLSNYICASHQVFSQPQQAKPVEAKVQQVESKAQEPVVMASDAKLFAEATEKANSRPDLSPEDQEVYAVVLYKKAFKEKTGSLEGAFSTDSELSEAFAYAAKEKMTQYRKKKSAV